MCVTKNDNVATIFKATNYTANMKSSDSTPRQHVTFSVKL